MPPFKRRDRDELLLIIAKMADEFALAAEAHKQDAVLQIQGLEQGDLADMNEAIHRSVQAIAFTKLALQLREVIGIAEGRRSAARWIP